MATSIENLPTEVVHQILSHLHPKDVSRFRMQGRRYAAVGAEYLATRIRFSTDEDSLDRIAFYADNPAMAKRIDNVVYEANVLAYRTRAEYMKHFQADHHTADVSYPDKLEPDATERAKRLYNRSLAQWEAARSTDYDTYQSVYSAQQSTLHSQRLRDVLGLLAQFPNIEHIKFSTEARCGHMLSQRFLEKYPLSCTMPMELNSDQSTYQLTSLIFPRGSPLRGLKSLELAAVNPRVFNTSKFKSSAAQVFESLRRLRICFRLQKSDKETMDIGTMTNNYCFVRKGCLKECLTAAKDLLSLTVNFDDLGYYGPTIDVKHILGNNIWPKLECLDIDCMKGGADIVEYFKRQPVLKHLNLSFMYLEQVAWRDIIIELKRELSLDTFTVRGLLEDEANYYSAIDIDEDAYVEDRVEIELADVLEDYVTEKFEPAEDDTFNPLSDINWSDPDSLYARYGSIDEMELMSTEDGESDEDDSDDSDESESDDAMVLD